MSSEIDSIRSSTSLPSRSVTSGVTGVIPGALAGILGQLECPVPQCADLAAAAGLTCVQRRWAEDKLVQ